MAVAGPETPSSCRAPPSSIEPVMADEDDTAGVGLWREKLCDHFHPHRQHLNPPPARRTTSTRVAGRLPRRRQDRVSGDGSPVGGQDSVRVFRTGVDLAHPGRVATFVEGFGISA